MKIYCDGSAYPNPGPGGFGVIIVDNHENFVYNIYRERCENTTNNREELKAVLYCLKNYGINIYEATTLDSFLLTFQLFLAIVHTRLTHLINGCFNGLIMIGKIVLER